MKKITLLALLFASFGLIAGESDPVKKAVDSVCDSSESPKHCRDVLEAYTKTVYLGAYLDTMCDLTKREEDCDGYKHPSRVTVREMSK